MNVSIDKLFQTMGFWIERKVSQTYNKPAGMVVSIEPFSSICTMYIRYNIDIANAMHIRSLTMEALMYFCDRYKIDKMLCVCTKQTDNDPDDKYTRWFTWDDGEVVISTKPSYGESTYIIPSRSAVSSLVKDVTHTYLKPALNSVYGLKPTVTKIIFSGPCTIVLWSDGDKTMVRRQGDEPDDKEKAVLAAVAKKFLGSNPKKSDYLDKIKPCFEKALKNLEEHSKKEKSNE